MAMLSGILFFYALIFIFIFAVFLHRLVHERSSDKESAILKMKVLYSMELMGFACGYNSSGVAEQNMDRNICVVGNCQ